MVSVSMMPYFGEFWNGFQDRLVSRSSPLLACAIAHLSLQNATLGPRMAHYGRSSDGFEQAEAGS